MSRFESQDFKAQTLSMKLPISNSIKVQKVETNDHYCFYFPLKVHLIDYVEQIKFHGTDYNGNISMENKNLGRSWFLNMRKGKIRLNRAISWHWFCGKLCNQNIKKFNILWNTSTMKITLISFARSCAITMWNCISLGNASSTKQLSIILWNLRVKEQMVTKVVFVSTS